MKTLSLLLMLLLPACAAAVGNPKPAGYKGGAYKALLGELLENCTGVDKKIAVANFAYLDEKLSGDGGIVSERLTTELVRLKKFKVTERAEIEKVLSELKLQGSGAMDADSVKSAGKMLGADWMIVGTLTELPGRQIEVNARLVGVESGEIINACSARIKKDWREKAKEPAEENELRDKDELREYDKAIRKYMDEKNGPKKQVKEPPSF